MERKWFDLTPRQILILTAISTLAGAASTVVASSSSTEVLSHVAQFSGLELDVDLDSELIMLQLTNQTRSEYGLPPLVLDPTIRSVAIAHSRDMLVRDFFAHINPDGETHGDRLRRGGVDFRRAGENLAEASSIPRAHQALMESESHRIVILDLGYTRIGIGVIATGNPARYFITENFTG